MTVRGDARNRDERPVAEGGGGVSARPLLAADRGGFVDRHDLWSEAQYAAAGQMRRVMDEVGIDLVRFSFVDQHGVLRGKAVTRDHVPSVLRDGIAVPSSLLLKDTSGRSVFAVFSADVGVGTDGFSGAGDLVLVPDPTTFKVLPWANRTGWVLCDLRFPDGLPVPFCTRGILRDALAGLADRGYGLTIGAELEFHVFRLRGDGLDRARIALPGAPGSAPEVDPTSPGAQLLHEEGLDALDTLVEALRDGLTRLDLPLRSIELEFGHSQLELTLAPADALAAADSIALARAAIRQICRRLGCHATFMARPVGAESASTGWHLHQSLRDLASGAGAFVPSASEAAAGAALSSTGRRWLAGLLEHAAAATAFTTPTVNGYKRYRAMTLAPDRIVWGLDNRGGMVRAIVNHGEAAARLENRVGEPAANPYLYIVSQIVSGLDGLDRELDPGPPTTDPYVASAPRLPASLGDALDALERDAAFAAALGDDVIAWFTTLKRAEMARYLEHVSDWEQREYFALF